MPLPDFTADEQYLINSVKSPTAFGRSNSYMWSYLSCGAIIAGFAAYYGSIRMLLSAFVVVCGFRIYEERYQLKWMPLWRSIIAKYESAAVAKDHSLDAGDGES